MLKRRGFLLLVACTAISGAAACTSLLGDFAVGMLPGTDASTTDGDVGTDGGNPPNEASILSDSAADAAANDGMDGPDAGGDAAVDKVVQISAGGYSACAVTSAGALYCWGYNSSGAVGDGTTAMRTAAVRIALDVTGAPLGPVAQVSAGALHTCATLKDGSVYCWGDDSAGQLGDGANLVDSGAGTLQRNAPQRVAGVTASFVESGFVHTCVPSANGYWCWGSNSFGELGHDPGLGGDQPTNGLFDPAWANSTPEEGAQVAGSTQGSLGLQFSCATSPPADRVLCWGTNETGQLGNVEAGASSVSPIPVLLRGGSLMTASKEVAASSALYHACAVSGQGDLYCWGSSGAGALGPGVAVGSGNSNAVEVMTGVSHVSVGLYTTCAIDATSRVQCWGANDFGQLGHDPSLDPIPSCHDNGGPCNPTPTILKAAGGGTFGPATAISVGGGYACALKDDATVWCWGRNALGELGNAEGGADAGDSYVPVQVAGLP